MKTLIYILAFVGIISSSYAQVLQPSEVPNPVQKAFTHSYPKAENVAWNRSGDTYQATFMDNQMERLVTYNESGKFVQKEEQVSIGQLPTPALKYINDNVQNGYVKVARKISKPGGKSYFLVMINDMSINFDSGGKFLSSTGS